jgi:DNA-binding response OmpR family regulator
MPPLVLVVDDDEELRDALVDVLTHDGYEVRTARDGVEALHVLDEVTPDVLVLDLMMPRMDGIQLVQELERRGRRGQLPILVLTARRDAAEQVQQLGVQGLVRKPFDLAPFLAEVARLAQP